MFGINSKSKNSQNLQRQMQMFEIDMMQMVFASMSDMCLKKCIPSKYSDGELSNGESVCLDRCVAKFMEAYMHTTKKLSNLNQQTATQTQSTTS